jgi:hypothetical protein
MIMDLAGELFALALFVRNQKPWPPLRACALAYAMGPGAPWGLRHPRDYLGSVAGAGLKHPLDSQLIVDPVGPGGPSAKAGRQAR